MTANDSLTMSRPLETAVLLVIFNRPEHTERAIRAIAKVRPRHLLVAADGPRGPADVELCARTREMVKQIDWDCEILHDFSTHNVGCGVRVHQAVSWALTIFHQVIVLEDDCIASPSFFVFCEELLGTYSNDHRIMHVGGFSLMALTERDNTSYYFSKYAIASGGWATWRRAWDAYDWSIAAWPVLERAGLLDVWCEDDVEKAFWKSIFDKCFVGMPDAWDYQWNFALWANSGLAALPTASLLTNHGYGADATHTPNPIPALLREPATLSAVVHPKFVLRDYAVDQAVFEHCYGGMQMRERRTFRFRLRSATIAVVAPIRRAVRRAMGIGA